MVNNEPGWHFKEMHHSRVSLSLLLRKSVLPALLLLDCANTTLSSKPNKEGAIFKPIHTEAHIMSFIWYIDTVPTCINMKNSKII